MLISCRWAAVLLALFLFSCNKKTESLLPLDTVFLSEIRGIHIDTTELFSGYAHTRLSQNDRNDVAVYLCFRAAQNPGACVTAGSKLLQELIEVQSNIYHLDYSAAYRRLEALEPEIPESPSYALRLMYFEMLIACVDQRVVNIPKDVLTSAIETLHHMTWPDPVLEQYGQMVRLYLESVNIFMTNAYNEALIPAYAAVAIHHRLPNGLAFPSLYADILYLIGKIYSHDEPYPLAEYFFRKSLQQTDSTDWERRQLIKTNLFYLADLQEKTVTRDSLFSQLYQIESDSVTPGLKYTHHRLIGYYHFLHGNLFDAKQHFQAALSAFNSQDSCSSQRLALYNSLADIALAENNIDSAVYFNTLALKENCLPEHMHIEQLWHIMDTRSDLQYTICREKMDSNSCIQASRSYYDLQNFLDAKFDISDPHLSDASVYNTEEYLDHLMTIGALFDRDSLHSEAAHVMRASKSRALIRGLARAERDAILDKDKDYREAHGEVNRLLKITGNLKSPEFAHDSIYLTLYDRYQAKRAIEQAFAVKSLTVQPSPANAWSRMDITRYAELNDVQIVQFLGTVSTYYVTYFSKDTSALYRIPRSLVDSCLEGWNNTLFTSDSLVPELARTLTTLSQILFNDLIDKDVLNILILPDLNLAHFPFEVLIVGKEKSPRFMIEDHVIGYHYDLHQMLSQDREETDIASISVLSWSDEETIGKGSMDYPELPGGFLETKTLCNLAKTACAIWSGEELTIANFEKSLSADFLHVSTHATSSPINRLDNYFLLRKGQDAIKYYAYNLPTQEDHLKHVVLSACESGTGTYMPGDGVYSISREFIRTGSSIVTKSLWKIPDMATASLLSEYYSSLFRHATVPEALQSAKLKIIQKNGRFQHPRSWAMLVAEGHPFMTFNFVTDVH